MTVSNVSGIYGTSAANTLNGTTGFSETGLLGGQTIGSVTLATNATSSTSGNYNANTGSNPASWTITASAATGGTFNANNYSITYDTGTQTISSVGLDDLGHDGGEQDLRHHQQGNPQQRQRCAERCCRSYR